jgi:hypothetical protein
MFQAGGEVTPIVIQSEKTDVGSARNPRLAVVNIEQENDKFYQRTRDLNGNLIGTEKEIQLEFSATRDPLDALQKQTQSETLKGLGALAVGVPLTVAAVASTPAIGSAIGTTALGLYARRTLAPKITQGFSKLANMFVRRSDDKSIGKYGGERVFKGAGKITGPSVLGYSALAVPPALGVRGILEDISPEKVDEITEETDPDKLSGSLFDPLKPKEPGEPEEPKIVYDKAKISNVLSDAKFDAFLNALAGTLNTGSFTAAGQAPLLAAQALQAGQDSGAIKTTEAKTNAEFNKEILTNINEFERTEKNLSRLQYATSLVDKGATGLSGLFGKVWTQALAAINDRQEIDFEGLDARTQADAILNALRQQDIQKLLGESGRTISNLDREIVAEIFGSITVTSTPAEIKEKLKQIAFRYRGEMKKNRNNILSGIDYFNQTNMPSTVLVANADSIKKILDISDFQNYKPPVYDPKAEGFFDASGGNVIDAGSLGD